MSCRLTLLVFVNTLVGCSWNVLFFLFGKLLVLLFVFLFTLILFYFASCATCLGLYSFLSEFCNVTSRLMKGIEEKNKAPEVR